MRLKDRFKRLYRLESKPEVTVNERVVVEEGKWSFMWQWRRQLSGRLLGEFSLLTAAVEGDSSLGTGPRLWKCKVSGKNVFCTNIIAKKLDELILQNDGSATETLRNNIIPQKVGIFIWRALRKRIPVRDELVKKGMILDSLNCPMCNEVVETVDHALLSCKFAKDIWLGVYKWWGLSFPLNDNIDNILKGDGYIGSSGFKKKIWQVIVWTTGHFIWKNRNQQTFKDDCWAPPRVISEIQIKTFEWIISRSRIKSIDWHQWLLHPSSLCFPQVNNRDPG
ncbi:uncharacterized protein [Rutidosis leptorrhynchoides]|uniref:uncharacterized protein n=1 Tax=Rutidosis leptorrhynchoides TaxID=125765 RepID=UPI003A98F32C